MASFERGIFVKRNGAWEEILIPSVKYDSAWHDITAGYVKHNGKWQQFYPSSGITYWICPLSYTWKVPAGIHEITVNLAAGGGGGNRPSSPPRKTPRKSRKNSTLRKRRI